MKKNTASAVFLIYLSVIMINFEKLIPELTKL